MSQVEPISQAERSGAEESDAGSRRTFLKSSAGMTGLLFGGAALSHAASPKHTAPRPTARQSKGGGGGTGAGRPRVLRLPDLYPNWNKTNFGQIQTDENAHVAFLVKALGSAARPKPTFVPLEQPDVYSFAYTSYKLENVGVGAYLGAAPIINSRAYLAAAGSILTIEARHSGYLGTLLNNTMDLGGSFDNPPSLSFILAQAGPLVQSLNGGPPPGFDMTPSDANDIAILNTALLLEYLEAEFYNINVPKFFP